jgi:hypothetical protein
MAPHAVHLVAAAAIVAGLFAAVGVIERRPATARVALGRPGGTPRSREAWERSLFGLPSSSAAPSIPALGASLRGGRSLDLAGAAAALSFLAGAVHIAALPEHVGESLLFGAFFGVSGTFQVATGLALRARASRVLWAAVLAANAGVAGLWVLSRTTGVPAGPRPWVPERIGPLDAVATLCEIALVVLAVFRLRNAVAKPDAE